MASSHWVPKCKPSVAENSRFANDLIRPCLCYHSLNTIKEAKNMEFNECLEGNVLIEEAIARFHEDSSRENLVAVLEAIRQRMHEDGQFILPVIPPRRPLTRLTQSTSRLGIPSPSRKTCTSSSTICTRRTANPGWRRSQTGRNMKREKLFPPSPIQSVPCSKAGRICPKQASS